MIYNENCINGMKKLDTDSVDLIVTDPPYGMAFMGKQWDKALPPIEAFEQMLRVLKPGAFAFVMYAPRSDLQARMSILLEDAGFNIAFTPIYWTFATGFPKAQNISKQIDKRNGRTSKEHKELGEYLKDQRTKKGLSTIKVCDIGNFYNKTNHGGAMSNWEKGKNVPTMEQYKILKPLLELDNRFDKLIEREEAQRKVLGIKTKRTKQNWCPTSEDNNTYITEDATPEAQKYNGAYAGFQPKPAVEVVIVAMKPKTEKTYVDQCLSNGHGITWLDDCRIPYKSESDSKSVMNGNNEPSNFIGNVYGYKDYDKKYKRCPGNTDGRFPANLLVSDDSLNDGIYRPSSSRPNECNRTPKETNIFSDYNSREKDQHHGYNDSGSYSRYFDLDAWFAIIPKPAKSEKNKGCEDLPEKIANPNYGSGGFKRPTGEPDRKIKARGNHHPTVKPIKLMSYLITLGSRPGQIVLDPFMGSGTTGIAAKQLEREFIGYELEEEYFNIAEARINAHGNTKQQSTQSRLYGDMSW